MWSCDTLREVKIIFSFESTAIILPIDVMEGSNFVFEEISGRIKLRP